ncbi:MAG: ferrous iron transport protein A [Bacillota bacterium]|nr:ferrous iron transport protein A [Bacillota bacterium]
MSVTLENLQPGQKARIKKITGDGPIRRRLLDMGLTASSIIEMERYAPLGDPVEIKLNGEYHVSLRKEEADSIILED